MSNESEQENNRKERFEYLRNKIEKYGGNVRKSEYEEFKLLQEHFGINVDNGEDRKNESSSGESKDTENTDRRIRKDDDIDRGELSNVLSKDKERIPSESEIIVDERDKRYIEAIKEFKQAFNHLGMENTLNHALINIEKPRINPKTAGAIKQTIIVQLNLGTPLEEIKIWLQAEIGLSDEKCASYIAFAQQAIAYRKSHPIKSE